MLGLTIAAFLGVDVNYSFLDTEDKLLLDMRLRVICTGMQRQSICIINPASVLSESCLIHFFYFFFPFLGLCDLCSINESQSSKNVL